MFSDGMFVANDSTNIGGDLGDESQWDMPEPPKPISDLEGGFTKLLTHTKTDFPRDDSLFTPLQPHRVIGGTGSESSWLHEDTNDINGGNDTFSPLGAFGNLGSNNTPDDTIGANHVANSALFGMGADSGGIWGQTNSFQDQGWGAPKKKEELNANASEWQPGKEENVEW
eukprot:UC4_evm1s177